MKIVNLFGGPCAGKSTTAAYLFYQLKSRDYRVELVTEYAKDVVYETKNDIPLDQLYIFTKQRQRIVRLLGNNISVVISDSPLILSCVYSIIHESSPSEYFCPLVKDIYSKFDNINIFINRNNNEYEQIGRVETKEEAFKVDEFIKYKMDKWGIRYKEFDRNENEKILEYVIDSI